MRWVPTNKLMQVSSTRSHLIECIGYFRNAMNNFVVTTYSTLSDSVTSLYAVYTTTGQEWTLKNLCTVFAISYMTSTTEKHPKQFIALHRSHTLRRIYSALLESQQLFKSPPIISTSDAVDQWITYWAAEGQGLKRGLQCKQHNEWTDLRVQNTS